MNDIAIVHKDYDVRGGGELLAEELARTFDCPLYVGQAGANAPDDDLDIRELFDGRLATAAINRGGLTRALAYAISYQQDASELAEYDTLILSGNEPLWYVPRDDQTVVAYTHSTARYQTDLWHERDMTGPKGRFGALCGWAQRVLYQPATRRPDVFVANSDLVARRIQRYWNIPEAQIETVYPPVATQQFGPSRAPTEDYYFSVSRLCQAKRYGEVIEAFADTEHELKIAGTGPEEAQLREQAARHPNIELLGYIPEAEKQRRLAAAKAFVFNASNEDFGIAPVEALASGTPVLGVEEGFTQFQVQNGETGYCFERGELGEAVARYERDGVDWSADQIAGFAARFDVESFRNGMRRIVAETEEQAAVSVPWEQGRADEEPPEHAAAEPVADGGGRDV